MASLTALLLAPPAHALRIVNWNILNYPASSPATRNPSYRTVLGPLAADVLVVQEIDSTAAGNGVTLFLANVLDVLEPGQWAAAPYINGNDTNNGMFYKPARVQLLGQRAFYVSSDATRLVNEYRIRPTGYASTAVELRLYSLHLKASTGSSNEQQRLREATGLRDTLNNTPPGSHLIAMGDYNIYSGAEPAFTKLREPQADDDGRLYDPLNAPLATWNNGGLTSLHTQSTSAPTHPFGGASGGLDDRFDMFLPTYNLNDGVGLELVPGSYVPVGNDGQHFNLSITDPPTIPEGAAYASALLNSSDHLPVRLDIRLPALAGVPASLALGDVIVAGTADLAVSNVAIPPAEALAYSLAAPSGFTAPGGTFNLAAGAGALHAVGTAPGPFGPRAGSLAVSSNDPDAPVRTVSLSANVLDHAHASLDSTSEVTAGAADFGTHPAGGFSPQTVTVHNAGYSSQQARLSVTGAAIAGGDGRFSIAGGFTPALVAGVGRRYEVLFDDAGATPETTYAATLTLSSSDEPLPGAAPRPDLSVALSARLASTPLASPGPAPPATTRLHSPFPNPLVGSSRIALDLAARTDVRIDVLDLAGRGIAELVHRELEPGRHAFSWSGSSATGAPVPPGLYFLRLSGRGVAPQTVRIAVMR